MHVGMPACMHSLYIKEKTNVTDNPDGFPTDNGDP